MCRGWWKEKQNMLAGRDEGGQQVSRKPSSFKIAGTPELKALQLWIVSWGFIDLKSSVSVLMEVYFLRFLSWIILSQLLWQFHSIFFSKNKIIMKEILFITFETLSSECSLSQAKVISECYIIFQCIKAPLLTVLYHSASFKKIKPDDIFGLLVIWRSVKNLMLYASSVHYFCTSLSFII